LDIPGTVKTETITDGFSVPLDDIESFFHPLALRAKSMSDKFPVSPLKDRMVKLQFLEAASPTHKVSWLGLFFDIKNIPSDLYLTIINILSFYKSSRLITLFDLIRSLEMSGKWDKYIKYGLKFHS
jgi:hypothetical protein